MENNRPLNDMLATTIQQIRDTVDANTVVGGVPAKLIKRI